MFFLNAASMPQAAAPAFDPNFEFAPDPGFDDPIAGTISGAGISVTGSKLVAAGTGGAANIVYVPTAPIVAGTYLFTLDTATVVNNGLLAVAVGGTASNVVTNPAGPHSIAITVAAVTSQTIKVGNFLTGKSGSWNSMSVKRTS